MIRLATAEDASCLAALEQASASHPWSAAAMDATLALPTTCAFVAWDGDRPVGHLVASTVADTGEVLTVGVLPEARRRGWGSRLLGAVEDHWRAAGVVEAFLEVREGNVGAIALYRCHGWEEVGRRRGYYADGEDAVLMRWKP